jgi:outer membrane lipoprotein-sorting protein
MRYSLNTILLIILPAIFAIVPVCAEEQRKIDNPPQKTLENTSHSIIKKEKGPEAKSVLNQLQRDMAPITEIDSEFTQLKKLAIFSKALLITGRMKIRMPRYFKWEVLSPLKSSVEVDDENVTIWDEETDKKVVMSLKDNPVAGGIWTQIDSFFMGRYDSLKKMYDIKLLSTTPLTFRFIPLSKPLSTVMKNVTLTFAESKQGRYLQRVVMRENGGDSTTIDFKNVRLHR